LQHLQHFSLFDTKIIFLINIEMVYNKTKKTASIDSLKNLPSGGGEKKAGLPYQIGRDHWFNVYGEHKPLIAYRLNSRPARYSRQTGRMIESSKAYYKIV
jgi:hypothetical protein